MLFYIETDKPPVVMITIQWIHRWIYIYIYILCKRK